MNIPGLWCVHGRRRRVIGVVALPCLLRYENQATVAGIDGGRRHADSLDLHNPHRCKRVATLKFKAPRGKESASQLAKIADVRYKTPLDRAAVSEDIVRDAWMRAHAKRVDSLPARRGINIGHVAAHVECATA